MDKFAVMGNPIAQSMSPYIHQTFAEQFGMLLQYEPMLVPTERFEQAVHDFFSEGGNGLNITMPFKEQASKLVHYASSFSSKAQAVNTIWQQEKKLFGDNTDGIGFIRDLNRYVCIAEADILILGAGGAARAIALSLIEHHPQRIVVYNRTLEKAMHLKSICPSIQIADTATMQAPFSLIIQTAPGGALDIMTLLPNLRMTPTWLGYDLCYNLAENTSFVTWAQTAGGQAVDGWGMLVEQAAEAFYRWHRMRPDTGPLLNKKDGIAHPLSS